LHDPAKYDEFARDEMESEGKILDVIYGVKDGKSEIQAYRYPKDTWTEQQARSHCSAHDGIDFEPANEERKAEMPERRSLMTGGMFLKEESGKRTLTGYAARFGVISEDLGGWKEVIRPGFFTDALRSGHDVYALFNHRDEYILGERNAGTLRLEQDDIGLRFEIDIPDAQWVRDMIIGPVERGELKGNSFGFETKPYRSGYKWERDTDHGDVRVLLENGASRLYDVSPVTYPAYHGNPLALRTLNQWRNIQKIGIEKSDTEYVSGTHILKLRANARKRRHGIWI